MKPDQVAGDIVPNQVALNIDRALCPIDQPEAHAQRVASGFQSEDTTNYAVPIVPA